MKNFIEKTYNYIYEKVQCLISKTWKINLES